MCFDGNVMDIGRFLSNMMFDYHKGVEIVIQTKQMLADVGHGALCLAIGGSNMLDASSSIIGNFHQQNLWVEFDLANLRVGFGKADCIRISTDSSRSEVGNIIR
ncbi:hypothetical protein FEM48_Zijuj04G0145900 [Ziziphus jujuba var. spinosa]|uniref:Peptidase A1 domain-containing protein n=1 Tax=Ziziphus jujuba var. spinosa TaxID=714518 RepID=A0A978VKF6_ZIZJJ|nr:hypothetical protein FEM48_Zijuj04G0145900 [Ziziphus jujuba var. spinosa]